MLTFFTYHTRYYYLSIRSYILFTWKIIIYLLYTFPDPGAPINTYRPSGLLKQAYLRLSSFNRSIVDNLSRLSFIINEIRNAIKNKKHLNISQIFENIKLKNRCLIVIKPISCNFTINVKNIF